MLNNGQTMYSVISLKDERSLLQLQILRVLVWYVSWTPRDVLVTLRGGLVCGQCVETSDRTLVCMNAWFVEVVYCFVKDEGTMVL